MELVLLTDDEVLIVRGMVGLASPVGGILNGKPGRVWGPVTAFVFDRGPRSAVACRACGRDVEKGQEAIRFGFVPRGSGVNARPAYIHREECRL